MGKTSKWIRNFLTGKKERSKEKIILSECGFTSPVPGIPKEKRRWNFRRCSATRPPAFASTLKVSSPLAQQSLPTPPQPFEVANVDTEHEENKDASTAEIAVAAEEFAAVKIQAYYRSHLARKALRALKGLAKLQALVRGHLVRKQATATLRCMQALITLQAKAREQRIRMIGSSTPKSTNPRTTIHKTRINNMYHENDEKNMENVEMEIQSKFYSPAPSITDMSPRYSSHFEDCNAFKTAQSSPQCFRFKEYYNGDTLSSYGYPLFPNYMANTQSSKAKARSQSAPKQRPHEIYEKHTSPKRRSNVEAPRNSVVKAVRMQIPSVHSNKTTEARDETEEEEIKRVGLDDVTQMGLNNMKSKGPEVKAVKRCLREEERGCRQESTMLKDKTSGEGYHKQISDSGTHYWFRGKCNKCPEPATSVI